MYKILKLNEISNIIDKAFDKNYKVTDTEKNPDAVLVRSFDMNKDYKLNDSLLAVGRAGAGVNNIPVAECAKKGIVVFNTPGANANAVKELVLADMLLASRKIYDAIEWTKTLKGKGDEVPKLVEKGKNAFVGGELLNKKLAIIGLGAIGSLVADSAIKLGMEVMGYDPYISVETAWLLPRGVQRYTDLKEIVKQADYITLHVPLTPNTKGYFNKELFAVMKDGVAIINCSRNELVNNTDIIAAVKSGKVGRYMTDFPSDDLIGADKNIICVPHLGASTPEAEDNCALMAAKQLVDYLENGNITNSVNYPNVSHPKSGVSRVCVFHLNIKEMITQITGAASKTGCNIENFVDKSQGDYAYCIMDLNGKATDGLVKALSAIDGVYKVRVID